MLLTPAMYLASLVSTEQNHLPLSSLLLLLPHFPIPKNIEHTQQVAAPGERQIEHDEELRPLIPLECSMTTKVASG